MDSTRFARTSGGRLVSFLAALSAAAVLVAGCGHAKETHMNQDEAVALVDKRAHEAFDQLPPGATLKQKLHIPDMECANGAGDKSVFVETNYDVDFPAGWPAERSMAVLADYWAANGYKVVRDARSNDVPELFVEKESDGFRIGYLLNAHPNGGPPYAALTSSSPCFTPTGS